MKKTIFIIFMLACIIGIPGKAFASDTREVNYTVAVNAKYHHLNEEDVVSEDIVDGTAHNITEQDRNNEVLAGKEFDGYRLVVYCFKDCDSEAVAWIKECLGEKKILKSAYDIYLLNMDNERVELPAETEILISPTEKSDKVYGLSIEGNIIGLNNCYENGKIQFFSQQEADYYILTEKVVQESSDVKTGDQSSIVLWSYLSLFVFVGMMVIGFRKLKIK